MFIFGPLWFVLLILLLFVLPNCIWGIIGVGIILWLFTISPELGIVVSIIMLGAFALSWRKEQKRAQERRRLAKLAWEANVELIAQGMERAARRVRN
jgi:Pyruvate/2-oxoacid:ferredoxin oxidoreductase gamma subunit